MLYGWIANFLKFNLMKYVIFLIGGNANLLDLEPFVLSFSNGGSTSNSMPVQGGQHWSKNRASALRARAHVRSKLFTVHY